jgi:hydrophobic/amphiphilic exporter-1 (mainly G- bacteria), HAE1 family
MQWLANICVRRPILACVLIAVLVVVGVVGYRTLGVDKFPKVDFPLVTIVTPYGGASPTAVETDVSQKVEEAVNTVNGLDTLTSVSTEGVSLVIAQFQLEIDPDKAAQDINEHLATILRDLPPGSRPEVRKADPDAAPIIVLSVKGPPGLPVRDLTRFADKQVKSRIERLKGVGQVVILGGRDRQINLHLDPIRLAAAGVSALEVMRAIGTSNVNVPGGQIETGPKNNTLRIEGRAADPQEICRIVVRQQGDHPIRVADVVEPPPHAPLGTCADDSEEDAETAAVRNGIPAIALSVRKQTGTNTVAIVDSINAAVKELQTQLPAGYSVDVVRDNSIQIRTAADQVLDHLVIGAILAALVVLLFLGSVRSTVIAAIAIPVSIVSTFGLMKAFGFTLNMMTLLALALAVGIVIDDAIVVLENIYRFVDEKKMKPFQAAIHATKEIGLAVLATTMSLMAVFLPVAFMSGIIGRFMFSFGLTMAFAILVSMIVAFSLTPMMAARILPLPSPAGTERRRSIIERVSDGLYRPIARLYSAMLAFCLRHRWIVGVAILAVFVMVMPMCKKLGGDFIPANDEAQFEIYIQAPEGTTLEATTLIGERIARQVRALPEVDSTLVTVAGGDQRQSNVGSIYVHMTDPDQRVRSQLVVMDEVRQKILSQFTPKQPNCLTHAAMMWFHVPAGSVPRSLICNETAGVRVAAQPVNDFSLGGQNAQVSYVISGPDLDKLERYGKQVLADMKSVPGVVDLDSSLLDPVAETTVRPDLDRAAMLGVDPGDITNTLGVLVGGVEASQFEDKGDQYVVWLRAAERFRTDPNGLSLISVPSRTLGQVPLSDVIRVQPGSAISKITRQSRERAVTLTMNVSPGFSESTIVGAMEQSIKKLDMPPGYTAEPFGRSKEFKKMQGAFLFAILMAIVFMYLTLAAQFESLLYPLVIMLSLPLAVPFAVISLVITGGSLNIFSMLGIIVLFAMVKKNAILQVDHANGLRRQGLPRTEAVIAASRDRLRPILMTTFAFVAGMMPLITSEGVGSGMSKAMAQVVVGGQTLSLLLTLIAIPVIYTWFDDLARLWRKYGSWVGFLIGLGLGEGLGLLQIGIAGGTALGVVFGLVLGFVLGGLFPTLRTKTAVDRGASELGIVDIYAANK